MDTNTLLAEIDKAIGIAAWMKDETEAPVIVAYVGRGYDWRIVIASDGHGVDGTALKAGLVVHLTRELAQKAWALAEATRQ